MIHNANNSMDVAVTSTNSMHCLSSMVPSPSASASAVSMAAVGGPTVGSIITPATVVNNNNNNNAIPGQLIEDIASENYWLREKMKEINADRDRLLCEVANLRLELDMAELKRLPEDRWVLIVIYICFHISVLSSSSFVHAQNDKSFATISSFVYFISVSDHTIVIWVVDSLIMDQIGINHYTHPMFASIEWYLWMWITQLNWNRNYLHCSLAICPRYSTLRTSKYI